MTSICFVVCLILFFARDEFLVPTVEVERGDVLTRTGLAGDQPMNNPGVDFVGAGATRNCER